MDDFLWRAVIAGLLVAVLCGALGVFIVWRRMAYFGDTISHASILGIAFGLLLGINLSLGMLVSSVMVALALFLMRLNSKFSHDTILGVLAHSALSVGLVLLAFVKGQSIDINAWLFGDILAVSSQDVWVLLGLSVLILLGLKLIWTSLLSMTVNEDLAKVEGVNTALIGFVFTLLVAVTIALGIKVIGALLISSLLIIPAATARPLSKSPESMLLISMVVGCVSIVMGLTGSYWMDTPAGPSIVVAATILFILSQLLMASRRAV